MVWEAALKNSSPFLQKTKLFLITLKSFCLMHLFKRLALTMVIKCEAGLIFFLHKQVKQNIASLT